VDCFWYEKPAYTARANQLPTALTENFDEQANGNGYGGNQGNPGAPFFPQQNIAAQGNQFVQAGQAGQPTQPAQAMPMGQPAQPMQISHTAPPAQTTQAMQAGQAMAMGQGGNGVIPSAPGAATPLSPAVSEPVSNPSVNGEMKSPIPNNVIKLFPARLEAKPKDESSIAQQAEAGQPRSAPILSIDLVPMTSPVLNIKEHVTKDDWQYLKIEASANCKYVCKFCGVRGKKDNLLQFHENWQFDDENHVMILNGIVSLCQSCHFIKHVDKSTSFDQKMMAKDYLSKINGWTRNQTETYIDEALNLWRKRGNYQWHVDLSWLAQQNIKFSMERGSLSDQQAD
jgi:hypothetical protein